METAAAEMLEATTQALLPFSVFSVYVRQKMTFQQQI
jgi:hypothetical protein